MTLSDVGDFASRSSSVTPAETIHKPYDQICEATQESKPCLSSIMCCDKAFLKLCHLNGILNEMAVSYYNHPIICFFIVEYQFLLLCSSCHDSVCYWLFLRPAEASWRPSRRGRRVSQGANLDQGHDWIAG